LHVCEELVVDVELSGTPQAIREAATAEARRERRSMVGPFGPYEE
jgi:hypothetical protein